MATEQDPPKVPFDVRFRVLIIGRANAGKTTILQRICDTTESPKVYRVDSWGRRKQVQLDPSINRGEHNIEDELIFTNYKGHVFHDSRGFESGDENELRIVQEFVHRRSEEVRLNDRLHAIWYCVPMDNPRPSLDLKYFDHICPDKNVPVIAVFTKYDHFRREIKMKLEDQHRDATLLDTEVESIFQNEYLSNLRKSAPFVRLEGMHKKHQRCTNLIEITDKELSAAVSLMLMAVQKILPQVPDNVKFRVLIVGRANAGKTTILQRVCDTTESPEIYRVDSSGRRERVQLDSSIERGEHNIEDELIFTNHTGYVFHDSCGFQAGGEEELRIVQDFVHRKSQERRFGDRLHAIWFCIPMDGRGARLDLKYFDDICPDRSVPVIAVFTKFDQFRCNIRMKLEDEHRDLAFLDAEVESVFDQHYLGGLSGTPPFIRLERMHKPGERCTGLIEMTANALSGNTVALMLLAIKRDNLEQNIRQAVHR